jgi:hypothetical protein
VTFRDRAGALLVAGAWLLLGALMFSLGHSPDGGSECHPSALWTSGWFFLPPVLALATLCATRRRVAFVGSGVLLALWVLLLLPFWFLAAIAHGATCGGG